MKQTVLVSVCVLLLSGAAAGEQEKLGPVPNYKGLVEQSGWIIIPTTAQVGLVDPFGGSYTIEEHGGQEFYVEYDSPIFAASYVEFETSEQNPFNPGSDEILLTEVFAIDLEPGMDPGQVPPLAGFDPAEPALMPSGAAWFEGQNGTQYQAMVDTVPVGDLPMRLPGYDVSAFVGPPNEIVHIVQGSVPAAEFIPRPIEFDFEYLGYVEIGGEYPYQHSWALNITHWDPQVLKISDVDVEAPHVVPGYVEVIPPENWAVGPWYIGRYSYEANPGQEITTGGGTFGWKVNAKTPYVVPGVVYLTDDQQRVSPVQMTMVPGPGPQGCGLWGYAPADLNHDCYVNLADLAQMALQWLSCTDPAGADCIYDSIIGVGFAFDGEDFDHAATVAFLLEDQGEVLDAGDVILEYRGVAVSSGADLLQTINSLPDLAVGEQVDMLVLRQGMLSPELVSPVAREIPVLSASTSSENKKCVEIPITPSGKSCGCVSGDYICASGYTTKRKDGKVVSIQYRCADTGGNVCRGDWFTVK